MDFGGGQEIRFERRGRAGIVTMTRPTALNAVTHVMVQALSYEFLACNTVIDDEDVNNWRWSVRGYNRKGYGAWSTGRPLSFGLCRVENEPCT